MCQFGPMLVMRFGRNLSTHNKAQFINHTEHTSFILKSNDLPCSSSVAFTFCFQFPQSRTKPTDRCDAAACLDIPRSTWR